MAYASRSGRARTNASAPEAHAICDRCGFRYNHVDLRWQFDWAGSALINKRLLVCRKCLDIPQEQLRAIMIPADPVPIQNPRIEYFAQYETDRRTTSDGSIRVTEDSNPRVQQQTGEPPGGINTQPGTDPNAPGDSDPGLPYGTTEVPKTGSLT
jgi:hypothetical protein